VFIEVTNMNYIQWDTFLSVLYAIMDDLYQIGCVPLLSPKPGPQPELCDSEVLTLTLAQQLLGFETERSFLSFAAGNLRHLFPRLLDQSQFNRRVRALAWTERSLPLTYWATKDSSARSGRRIGTSGAAIFS
jgi:hypothetical protein